MHMASTALIDVRAELHSLAKTKEEFLAKIKKLEKEISLLPSQRAVMVFHKLDPEAVERERRHELSFCEQEISALKSKVTELCRLEFTRLSSLRDGKWAVIYATFVQINSAVCSDLVSDFAQLTSRVLAQLSASGDVAAFDTTCGEWNRFLDSIGAPANFKLTNPLGNTVRESLRSTQKPALEALQTQVNQLRQMLGLPVLLTESEWRQPKRLPPCQQLPPEHPSHWPGRIPE
jgi:inorganic triphosphatase YgiF